MFLLGAKLKMLSRIRRPGSTVRARDSSGDQIRFGPRCCRTGILAAGVVRPASIVCRLGYDSPQLKTTINISVLTQEKSKQAFAYNLLRLCKR